MEKDDVMFNRIYEKIKITMKENYKSILFFLILYVILMWPVDYYITTGGGTIDIKDRVKIENSYKAKGSLHLAYVSELEGNVATYLLSYIMKDWERVDSSVYKVDEEENAESIDFRNHLQLEESVDSAIQVAYQKAGKTFDVKEEHTFIIYVSKKNKNKLKVGDEILLVGGEKIKDFDDLRQVINSHEVGDKIIFKVKRGTKEKEIPVEVYQEENQKLVGISIQKSYDYKTDPKIKLSFKPSESGPSGGLMLSLDIYNKLTKEDITKGYKIVGTGTISQDGTVGEIGGVTYKLMGAVKHKADIFLVPNGENYKDAIAFAKKKHYTIKIIGVNNIDEALEHLKKLKTKER